jgi:hypothetical protein
MCITSASPSWWKAPATSCWRCSAPMIGLARRTAPEAQFQAASLYDVEFRPCTAVTALGEALNYYAVGSAP